MYVTAGVNSLVYSSAYACRPLHKSKQTQHRAYVTYIAQLTAPGLKTPIHCSRVRLLPTLYN